MKPAIANFKDFGTFLKYLRRRAQLTQAEVARACGYSTPHISHLESNQRLPDPTTLLALFVPALGLENEPDLVERLLELAQNTRAGHGSASAAAEAHVVRFINALPLDISSDTFLGRAHERAKVTQWLMERRRVISIYGRAGIGKTALACSVLADMERASVDYSLDGMVYLGAGVNSATGITLDRILNDFSQLMDEQALTVAERVWHNSHATHQQRVSALLDSLKGGHYVLLLDNLETHQHPETYGLTDLALKAFFHVQLERGGPLSVLVTSRYPLNLPNHLRGHEQKLLLEEGLPLPEAIALIRNLEDNKTAIPVADNDLQFVNIIEATKGFPRALEALAGYLKGGSLHTLKDLINDKRLLAGEVTDVIVYEAIQQLAPAAVRVLEALALLGRPVPLSALEHLLAPYMEPARIKPVIEQLVNSCFVHYNRATHSFTLHPIDSEYCLERIPGGSPDDVAGDSFLPFTDQRPPPYTRCTLNHRAATFFESQRKPQSEWKTLSDLNPQLAEFEYRVRAEDYDTAARLLLTFDFDYLMLWGKWQTMLSLHRQIHNKIKNTYIQMRCLWNLGRVYYVLGQIPQAIEQYEQGLTIARETGDRQGEAQILGSLGSAYSELGEEQRAIECYEQALIIAYESSSRQLEKDALHNLADACLTLGQAQKAISYFEQGLVIARELGIRRSECYALVSLGKAYHLLGKLAQAVECYEESLIISRAIGDRQGEGYVLRNLGEIYISNRGYLVAVQNLEASLEIFDEISYPHGKHLAGSDLAKAHLFNGHCAEARLAAETALQYDMPKNAPKLAAIYGCVLLALGEFEKAQSAFEHCITYATDLLTKSAQNYSVQYYRSLARAGLTLLGQETIRTALDDYQGALSVFDGKGVVHGHLQLLENLISYPGGDILQPVRDTLIKALEV